MKVSECRSARICLAIAALLATTPLYAQGIQQGKPLQSTGQQKPSAAVPLNSPLPPTTPTAFQPLPQQRVTTTISTVHRARVSYADGLLTVTANNSSLNQILREIARLTGIQILGGVTEDRVFGTYGPADLPTILAVLLDGTGSNMMLSGDNQDSPRLLTLTPRQGGISPPSPQQQPDTSDTEPANDLSPQLTPPTNSNPVGQPQQINSNNSSQQQSFNPPAVEAAPPDASAPTTGTNPADQSTNGVKTPQQIYDQLMKLQSQQPKAPQ